MFSDDEMSRRLSFAHIDGTATRLLPEIWAVVEPRLDEVLTRFHGHLRSVPELMRLTGNRSADLSRAQRTHWARLFTGRFDADYVRSVRAVGLAHHRIGLEPRWFIGGYSFVLGDFTRILVEAAGWRRTGLAERLAALDQALLFDMDVVLCVQQEALLEERSRRGRFVEGAIATFQTEAAPLVAAPSRHFRPRSADCPDTDLATAVRRFLDALGDELESDGPRRRTG